MKKFKVTVEYIGGTRVFVENAKEVEGEVRSGYNPNEILTTRGGYEFENLSFSQGWITISKEKTVVGTYQILEKNIEGHKRIYIEDYR